MQRQEDIKKKDKAMDRYKEREKDIKGIERQRESGLERRRNEEKILMLESSFIKTKLNFFFNLKLKQIFF